MSEASGEFYIGHEPLAPHETARFVRGIAVAIVLAFVALGAAIAARHTRLAPSVFEYGVVRELRGIVQERPHPMLLVARPGKEHIGERYSRYLLVGQGKRGAHELVAGMDGLQVRLSGSLVYRDGVTTIDVIAGTVVADVSEEQHVPRRAERLGEVTLAGEIVDAKCYLGVMNPGSGKTHRDCAVRCISGGSPPLVIARGDGGRLVPYLLAGPRGESINRAILARVGEPVEVTGVAIRSGDMLVLHAEPSAIAPRDPSEPYREENHDAE